MVTDELKELKTKMKIDESEQSKSNEDLFMHQRKKNGYCSSGFSL